MTRPPTYQHVAAYYDLLASLWSCGRIQRAKLWHLDQLNQSTHPSGLYVGAGTGKDALAATQQGFDVTAIEPCPAMYKRLARHLIHTRARCMQQSLDAIQGQWDYVAAHFFLNVFETTQRQAMLKQLKARLKPNGYLFLADFMPPKIAEKPWQQTLYCAPCWRIGRLLRLTHSQRNEDDLDFFNSTGLTLVKQKIFHIPGFRVGYRTILAKPI